ncbi:hypothetical protein [Prauserella flavalba]|uniref:hypothetical protein n=1 Tax=Prauserella flavalba TaxID=1477506 RepID=UPI0036F059EB
MTATVDTRSIPDPAVVLKRIDTRLAQKSGDDPLPPSVIDEFARGVRTQIIDPLTAGGLPAAAPRSGDDAQLRADNARLADELHSALRDNERITAAAEAEVQRHRRQAAEQNAQAEALANQRDDAQAEVRKLQRQLAETQAEAASAKAERDKLKSRLDDAEIDLAAAHKALDEQAADRVEPRRHYYPVPAPGAEPEPCACGQPYPRSSIEDRSGEPCAPQEPWAELIDRIRGELDEWPAVRLGR